MALLGLVFGLSLLWLTVIGFFVLGPPAVAVYAAVQSWLQRSVPDGTRGRAFGALGMVQGVAALVGMPLASGPGDPVGIRPLMNLSAAMWFVAGVVVFGMFKRVARGALPGERRIW